MPAPRPPSAPRHRRGRARRIGREPGGVVLTAEQLEDRDQPSAAVTVPDVIPLPAAPPTAAAIVRSADPSAPAAARHELILIDRDVPDRDGLVSALCASRPAGTAVEAVELSGGGVAEISAVLARYRGLDAVHILSHGEAGALHLGSDRLDAGNIDRFGGELRSWGASLSSGADLLLYGCDLAGTAAGRALAARIGGLTGADVAASTDLTGAAALGGDWQLEYRTGSVETAAVTVPGTWAHTLAAPGGLLLVTSGNVNNGGSPGLASWNAGTVVDVGDPNFALEPGGTGGTFTRLFDLNPFAGQTVQLDAVHYVRHAVTVGAGSASMALQPGDLLLSVGQDNVTVTSQNTLTVNKDDVFVFRPAVSGNYSSGTFLPLLDNLNAITGGSDVWAVAPVYGDTVVGDVTLPAGSFLLTRQGGATDNDIQLFVPTGVGAGTTAGTVSVLIEGDDLGITPKVFGVDLVESDTTLGGRALTAGTLLLALDNSASAVGTNGVSVTPYDVLALSVSQTTLGSGTAAADASLLFRGGAVGLDSGTETLRSFSLGPGNGPPSANDDTYTTNEDAPLVVGAGSGVLGNDSDPNGDALTAALATGPTHGAVVLNADGGFTYTPTADYFGADGFTYTVSDGRGGTATASVSITVGAVNDAPTFSLAGEPPAVVENTGPQTVAGFATGVRPGPSNESGQTVAFRITGNTNPGLFAAGPAVAADGTLTYTPAASVTGSATITLVLTDNGGSSNGGQDTSAARQFTVTVRPTNAPPIANPDVYSTGAVPLTVGAGSGVLANDADPDGDALTAAPVRGPAHGVLSLLGDGSFTYTPNAGFSGTDTFTYRAVDSASNASAPATVTINVVLANRPPAATNDAFTTAENTPLAGSVLGNDSDPDGDPLTVALLSGPTHGALVLNPDGTFTYTPAANYSGPDAFAYTLSDGKGGTASATVALTVIAANTPPTITPVPAQIVPEDGALGPVTFTVGDRETPPDSLTVTAASSNPALVPDANVALTRTGAGGWRLSLVPAPNAHGTTVITLTVSDGTTSTATTFAVTVTPANDAPAAADDAFTTARDTRLVVPPSGALVNDTDADGDVLNAELVSGPRNGTVQLNPDGSFVYDPAPGFVGTDSFTYRAVDSTGAISGTATVTIRVEAPGVPAGEPAPTSGPTAPRSTAPAPTARPPGPQLAPVAETAPAALAASTATGATGAAGEPSPNTDTTVNGGSSTSTTPSPILPLAFVSAVQPEIVAPADARPAVQAPPQPPKPPDSQSTDPPRVALPSTPPAVTPVPAAAIVPVSEPPPPPDAGAAAEAVAAGLDKVSRDIGADADARAATAAVVTTAVVATAGYVALNTRAVHWFISALLARPAVWSRFDPIDVICAWDEEQELAKRTDAPPQEGESLQSLVG